MEIQASTTVINGMNKLFNQVYAIEKRWEQFMIDNCGYQRKTTFMSDFLLAEVFGQSAVWDTYKRAEKEWFNNKEYCTELAMVLNHLCAMHYEHDMELSALYANLWEKIDTKIAEEITDEEFLDYYYKTTD